jgi:hypothetical protein
MDFSGPERTDFANVEALNRAFLLKLRSPAAGRRLRDRIPEALRDAIEGMTDRQVNRLSASPFLLLSLREHDAEFWRELEADSPVMDLFATSDSCRDEIAVAAASFIWQLTRRNPYAARLVTGASPAWCERLGEFTLLTLLERVAACRDLVRPRFANDVACWRKLLGSGLSSKPRIRESAYLACLQTLVTKRLHGPPQRMRAAACASSTPVLSITSSRRPS